MANPTTSDHKHFSMFKTAAEEAAETEREAWENEGGPGEPTVPPEREPESAVNELIFALHAEDVRLGIVRDADILDADGALSALGGSNYRRRATAILRNLTGASNAQIVKACKAEPADMPRGAAARTEARRRGLS